MSGQDIITWSVVTYFGLLGFFSVKTKQTTRKSSSSQTHQLIPTRVTELQLCLVFPHSVVQLVPAALLGLGLIQRSIPEPPGGDLARLKISDGSAKLKLVGMFGIHAGEFPSQLFLLRFIKTLQLQPELSHLDSSHQSRVSLV